jgi:hypothetical protein
MLPEVEPSLLLVDWLNELVFLAEVEGFVPESVERLELGDGLQATLAAVRGRPRHLVKAALNAADTPVFGLAKLCRGRDLNPHGPKATRF